MGRSTHDYLVSVFLCPLVLTFSPLSSAISQEADAIISFGLWSVFEDEVACWAASEVDEINSDFGALDLEKAMMFVSFFHQQPVPEVSFALGDCCEELLVAHLGDAQADFLSDDEGYYFPVEDDRDLLFALLGSRQLALSTPNASEPVVTFSLDGFKDAYNHLSKMCDFTHVDFMEGGVT